MQCSISGLRYCSARPTTLLTTHGIKKKCLPTNPRRWIRVRVRSLLAPQPRSSDSQSDCTGKDQQDAQDPVHLHRREVLKGDQTAVALDVSACRFMRSSCKHNYTRIDISMRAELLVAEIMQGCAALCTIQALTKATHAA